MLDCGRLLAMTLGAQRPGSRSIGAANPSCQVASHYLPPALVYRAFRRALSGEKGQRISTHHPHSLPVLAIPLLPIASSFLPLLSIRTPTYPSPFPPASPFSCPSPYFLPIPPQPYKPTNTPSPHRLKIMDDERLSDDLAAWACFRLDRCQPGLRMLHLYDANGVITKGVLLVRVGKTVSVV